MIFGLVLAIGALILFVVALVGIARSQRLSGTARAVWVLIILAFPLLGPFFWFFIGQPGDVPGSGTAQRRE
ncbi:hypothetical protein E8P82_05590 [Arthrobacter echini]|uniref:Cardiolipin synthase N-terminal domain-containing protein n=2 Tax=Arthrobacter echini TaxID=1529066 RepID=A0A4S5E6E1_9MICC|nr:hypothetical protein E8P82_05590 [Arthrobacter echini]